MAAEERHKGTWMEASASRYVGYFLKGNTTRCVEEGWFGLLNIIGGSVRAPCDGGLSLRT